MAASVVLPLLLARTWSDPVGRRPVYGAPPPPVNETGLYHGEWSWSGHAASQAAGPGSWHEALARLVPFTSFTFADGGKKLPSAFTGRVEGGACGMKLTGSPARGELLLGELELKAGDTARRYIVRGELSDDHSRTAVVAVPLSLRALVRQQYLNTTDVVTSFTAATAALARFMVNASLSVDVQGDSEMAKAAVAATTGPYSRVRHHPSSSGYALTWLTVREKLKRNMCVFIGDLHTKKLRMHAPLHPSTTLTDYALTGKLVSFNCDAVISVSVGQQALNDVLDRWVWHLTSLVVVSGVAVAGLRQQMRRVITQSALARVSAVSMINVALSHQILCAHHFRIAVAVPLFRPCVAVAFLNLLIAFLAYKHVVWIWEATGASAEPYRRATVVMFPASVLFVCTFPTLLIPVLPATHVVLWLPQIVHTMRTKSAKPVSPALLASELIFRVAVTAQTTFFTDQPLEASTSVECFCITTALLVGQTVFVMMQRVHGSNFMVPVSWQPQSYDYHRAPPPGLLPEAPQRRTQRKRTHEPVSPGTTAVDSEAGLSDSSAASGLECAICQAAVSVTQRSEYMLPPCDHIFHTECLQRWMEIKMECPVCRRHLPD